MKLSRLIVLSVFLVLVGCAKNESFNAKLAWQELVATLDSDYAYIDKSKDDFKRLTDLFSEKALATGSADEFINVSQAFLKTLQDPHLGLSPMDEDDYIVYPTGSDIYAEVKDNQIRIKDVKANSSAHAQGVRANMLVKKIDGLEYHQIIQAVTKLPAEQLSIGQQNYAINIALGGKRYQKRSLLVSDHQGDKEINLAASYDSINALQNGPKVSYKQIQNIGYIRFNNSLGEAASVSEFRQAISELSQSKGLIIDLRNTPSGGNTGVAEPILGHFTQSEKVYQLYKTQISGKYYADAAFQEALAIPQSPFINKPFVVLAGRWTGSMGEGMTIGLDALGAKAVLGAPMADLLGGIKQINLTHSDGVLSLGFERLYHVNGEFREDFKPNILIEAGDIDEHGKDQTLIKALQLLSASPV